MSDPMPALPDQFPETADPPAPPEAPAPPAAPVGPSVLVRFMPTGDVAYPVLRADRWWQPGSEYALPPEVAGALATEAGFTAVGPAPSP
jgi:hypothetical protein